MTEFVNKVADSGIITLNLEDFYPKEPVLVFDMKDYLFMGLILKETITQPHFESNPLFSKFLGLGQTTPTDLDQ